MEWIRILFYIFAALIIITSLLTVFSRNTVKAALFLILTFFSFAALWILLEAEFLAIILILVYIGAIMVLFLFVIKMLDIDSATLQAKFTRYLPLGIGVAVIMVIQMVSLFKLPQFTSVAKINSSENNSNITQLAMELYTQHVLEFELAAVILLIAIIATISLANLKSKNTKKQDIHEQIKVNPKDRLQIMRDKK